MMKSCSEAEAAFAAVRVAYVEAMSRDRLAARRAHHVGSGGVL